MEIDI